MVVERLGFFGRGWGGGWEKRGVGGLTSRGRCGGFFGARRGVVVVLSVVWGGCLMIHRHTDRDHVSLFRDVLMDGVVGKARKRTVPSGNNGFYFIGRRKFADAREDVVNAIRREHGEELRVTKSDG